jgi:hypothetical protein
MPVPHARMATTLEWGREDGTPKRSRSVARHVRIELSRCSGSSEKRGRHAAASFSILSRMSRSCYPPTQRSALSSLGERSIGAFSWSDSAFGRFRSISPLRIDGSGLFRGSLGARRCARSSSENGANHADPVLWFGELQDSGWLSNSLPEEAKKKGRRAAPLLNR